MVWLVSLNVPTGVAVIVDSSGHLGTITSSARFKEQIEAMDKTSEAILALKPVTFRYTRALTRSAARTLVRWLGKWKRWTLIWWPTTRKESPSRCATKR